MAISPSSNFLSPGRVLCVFLGVLAFLVQPLSAQWTPAPPELSVREFKAGTREGRALLTVRESGRYAVFAQSALGSHLSVTDRMSGLLGQDGVTGGTDARDGRVDLFLEAGDYLVKVDASATEACRLVVKPFTVVNAGRKLAEVPWLMDGETWAGELGDFQMRAWWVRSDGNTMSRLQALGRALRGMSLWKDGIWDSGVPSSHQELEIINDRPDKVLGSGHLRSLGCEEYNRVFDQGSWLLLCWGGQPREWGSGETAMPARLGSGGPVWGPQGEKTLVLGSLGTETMMIGPGASLVEAERAGEGEVRLGVSQAGEGRMRSQGLGARIAAGKGSKRGSQSVPGGISWVTVQGSPGEKVRLRWTGPGFNPDWTSLNSWSDKDSWYFHLQNQLSTDDQGELGFALLNKVSLLGRTAYNLRLSMAGVLAGGSKWYQAGNNLDSRTWVVDVRKAGTWTVIERDQDVSARYTFRPLDEFLMSSTTKPQSITAGQNVELQARPYLVTASKVKAGILHFMILEQGPGAALGGAGLFRDMQPGDRHAASFIIPTGSKDWQAGLVGGNHGGVGLVRLKLPLDLENAFPLDIEKGSTLRLPVSASDDLVLDVEGSSTGLLLDGKPVQKGQAVGPGSHEFSLAPDSPGVSCLLGGRKAGQVLKPAVYPDPASLLAALPVVADGEAWHDFVPGEKASWLIDIKENGAWHMETSGRLSMAITVRNPLDPGLFSARTNAPGGNASLDVWLRKGTYLASVESLGSSRGRGGLVFRPCTVDQAQVLGDSLVGRQELEAGHFLSIPLLLGRDAWWTLRTMARGPGPSWRLEDESGWPVGKPFRTGDLAEDLGAGRYQAVFYPSSQDERRVTVLFSAPVVSSPGKSGNLPLMSLGRTMSAVWKESPGREPQSWVYESSGRQDLVLTVNQAMILDLAGGKDDPVIHRNLKAGETLPLSLGAGKWPFGFSMPEKDDNRLWSFRLDSAFLLAGAWRDLAEGVLDVQADRRGFYEFWTLGSNEWECRLLDASGKILASSRNLDSDWNVSLMAWLEPGIYHLQTRSVGNTGVSQVEYPPEGAWNPGTRETVENNDDGSNQDEGGYQEDEGQYDVETEDYGQGDGGSDYESGDGEEDGYGGPGGQTANWIDTAGFADASPSHALDIREGESRVFMEFRPETRLESKKLPFAVDADASGGVLVIPLGETRGGLLSIQAEPALPLDFALIKDQAVLAQGKSSLKVALGPGAGYELRVWMGGNKGASFRVSGDIKDVPVQVWEGGSLKLAPGKTCIQVQPRASLSATILQPGLLVAAGPNRVFRPLVPGEALPASPWWLMKADRGLLDGLVIQESGLVPGSGLSMDSGEGERSFNLVVPSGFAGYLKASGEGLPPGMSARQAGAGSPPGNPGTQAGGTDRDWSRSCFGNGTNTLVLAPGTWSVQVWSPSGNGEAFLTTLGFELYPLDTVRPVGDTGDLLSVPAGRAVLSDTGGKPLALALEDGLFASLQNERILRTVQAGPGGLDLREAPAANARLLILNPGKEDAMVQAGTTRYSGPSALSREWEGLAAQGDKVRRAFDLDQTQLLWVYGALEPPRFHDSRTGLIVSGRLVTVMGEPAWEFAGSRGFVDFAPRQGLVRLWSGKKDEMESAFFGSLPSPSGPLAPGSQDAPVQVQSWTISLAKDGIQYFSMPGGGALMLSDQAGRVLGLDAGTRQASLALRLRAGSYRLAARPLAGQGAWGTLAWKTLEPVVVKEDGEGPPIMCGPRDPCLIGLDVAVDSSIGLGIASGADALDSEFFDQDFHSLGRGRVYFRELKAGRYWLLVSSPDAVQTFRLRAYGLAGNRSGVPEEVRNSYRTEE